MPRSTLRIALLYVAVTLLPSLAFSQLSSPPEQVCDVVESPARFAHKTIAVEGILSPSDHSLGLYGLACIPTEDNNVSIETILPTSWAITETGRKLRSILKRGHNAQVRLIGIFEDTGGPFGPDVARFRFTVS
jgi:hypothetical protein